MNIYSQVWEIIEKKPIPEKPVTCTMCNGTRILFKGSGFGRIGTYSMPCYCVCHLGTMEKALSEPQRPEVGP